MSEALWFPIVIRPGSTCVVLYATKAQPLVDSTMGCEVSYRASLYAGDAWPPPTIDVDLDGGLAIGYPVAALPAPDLRLVRHCSRCGAPMFDAEAWPEEVFSVRCGECGPGSKSGS